MANGRDPEEAKEPAQIDTPVADHAFESPYVKRSWQRATVVTAIAVKAGYLPRILCTSLRELIETPVTTSCPAASPENPLLRKKRA